jgi:creatinine amidohydrolase/Fe(II)-dependent formamide hydrolase-like protein
LREDLVKKGYDRPPDSFDLDKKMLLLFAAADEQNPIFGHSKDGLIIGNPFLATREKGEKMFEVISDEVAKFINDLLAAYVSESYSPKE